MSQIKLVIIGDKNVGKNSLVDAYFLNEYPPDYVSKTFSGCIITTKIDNKIVVIDCWLTSASDSEEVRKISYADADCFLLCFSIDDRTTFDNLRTKWVKEISNSINKEPKFFIVGTKADLRPSYPTEIVERRTTHFVTKYAMVKLFNEIKAVGMAEVSVKNMEMLGDIFELAAKAALGLMPTEDKTMKRRSQLRLDIEQFSK
ncbi:Rho family GTPase [Entamoeba marina]